MLSADFRDIVFSSLVLAVGGGEAAALRFGEALGAGTVAEDCMRGVCGLLAGRSCARLSSSASRSASDCCDGAGR